MGTAETTDVHQPVPGGNSRAGSDDRELTFDNKNPFQPSNPNFNDVRSETYGPGSGAGGRGEVTGIISESRPLSKDDIWDYLTLENLDTSPNAQCGVKDSLKAMGVDVDAGIRDGSLAKRLEQVFYRDQIEFGNQFGNQTLRDMGITADATDVSLDKNVTQLWADRGLQRPTLGPNATPAEMAAVLSRDIETLAMATAPQLRSMSPEEREKTLVGIGADIRPASIEAKMRSDASARVSQIIDCLKQ